jgi:hypothetical protein
VVVVKFIQWFQGAHERMVTQPCPA